MLPDYEKFNRALTFIEQNPGEWNQMDPNRCLLAIAIQVNTGTKQPSWETLTHGSVALGIPYRGYGLRYDMAYWLFAPQNTLEDFQRIRLVLARKRLAEQAQITLFQIQNSQPE